MAEETFPIEVELPDITPYRKGNVGVEYVTRFDSKKPGPHVLVVAITHGNEVCGAIALDSLLREKVRPTRGVLTLAFSNHAAYHSFDPKRPVNSRQVDQDINRVWDADKLNGDKDSVELRRARELRPVVDACDYMLDIHSMFFPIAPLMLCGPLPKGRAFARRLGYPEYVVSDGGHKEGRRMRDYGAFSDPASPKNALLVECGQHWSKDCAVVAMETTLRFLSMLDVVDRDWAESRLVKKPLPQKFIEVTGPVTIKSDDFKFAAPYRGYEVIAKKGTVIAHDGGEPITTPYDDCVLVMPTKRLSKGRTAVRLGRYVAPGA